MPLTIARPSPAPAPAGARRVRRARRAALPGHVEDPVHVLVRQIPPQPSVTLTARRRPGPPGPWTSTTPSAGVCRIAFITRLETTRDSPAGSAVTSDALLDLRRRAVRRAARATGSAPAIASLTTSPSATGCGLQRQHAGVDPGQLEEVVDHPHHPVDLGADLAVVARRVVGQAVLERLGHRPQPGQRRAQVVGDPRDQLAARLLQPRLARRATPPAARWSGPARRTAPGTRPARATLGDELRRCSPKPRASLAQRRATSARAPRRPRSANGERDDAGDHGDPERRPRGRGRRGTSPARSPTMPATTAPTATTRDADGQPAQRAAPQRARPATQPDAAPTPPDQAAAIRTIGDLVVRHVAGSQR